MSNEFYLTECPRDAMQGIRAFIPTEKKVEYLNHLLRLGFNRLDFGSFVSEKAIPQLKDTREVLDQLNESQTKLLAIVANERGADEALTHERIDFIGYPFSINNTFQLRNTGKTIEESLGILESIQTKVNSKNKKLVVYLSMAFGNPYDEIWDEEIATSFAQRLVNDFGVSEIMMSDTIGSATPSSIHNLFEASKSLPSCHVGAHLHSRFDNAMEKIQAAFDSGCRRFDGAFGGFGGCPMAKDDLVGNMPTELLLLFSETQLNSTFISSELINETIELSGKTMNP
jgi:hydroxymethylglutaryl-CoA lyase